MIEPTPKMNQLKKPENTIFFAKVGRPADLTEQRWGCAGNRVYFVINGKWTMLLRKVGSSGTVLTTKVFAQRITE